MKKLIPLLLVLLSLHVSAQKSKKELFLGKVYRSCTDTLVTPVVSKTCYELGLYASMRDDIFDQMQGALPAPILKALQIAAAADTIPEQWDFNLLPDLTPIKTDTLHYVAHQTVYRFSRPVYYEDKYALISMGYNCGMLCGCGCTYLFKRKGKKWILVDRYSCWVS